MNIIVRQAEVGDASDIATVQIAAWRSAYAGIMPHEFLNALDFDRSVDNWQNALQKPGVGSYIVAERDGAVKAFAVYGPARDRDLPPDEAAEIVAINVSPGCWRAGLGSALLDHIMAATAARAYRSIHLWVAEQNQRALMFYENHGFSSEGKAKHDPAHGDIREVRYIRRVSSSSTGA